MIHDLRRSTPQRKPFFVKESTPSRIEMCARWKVHYLRRGRCGLEVCRSTSSLFIQNVFAVSPTTTPLTFKKFLFPRVAYTLFSVNACRCLNGENTTESVGNEYLLEAVTIHVPGWYSVMHISNKKSLFLARGTAVAHTKGVSSIVSSPFVGSLWGWESRF